MEADPIHTFPHVFCACLRLSKTTNQLLELSTLRSLKAPCLHFSTGDASQWLPIQAAFACATRGVWEMALDRVPLAMLTFSKPKAWLTMRMKVQKGKYYKLAKAT